MKNEPSVASGLDMRLSTTEPFDVNGIQANPHSMGNRVLRILWAIIRTVLYRPTPNSLHKFRIMILKLFGADVNWRSYPYPRCRIWAPWNLKMAVNSCLANDVDCYNPARIELGELAIVSQYTYLCSASHDYKDPALTHFSKPITIEACAWVAARAYIGPGVTVGRGAVVGANACVYKNVPEWTVVGGNPARVIAHREVRK
jgi:putative colanic acid biosynthesis acetyltransferase WcaF